MRRASERIVETLSPYQLGLSPWPSDALTLANLHHISLHNHRSKPITPNLLRQATRQRLRVRPAHIDDSEHAPPDVGAVHLESEDWVCGFEVG